MADKTSHVFEGLGAALATTYSTGISASTSGENCQAYERITAYVVVGTVTSSGKVSFYCDFSDDGDTWYPSCSFADGGGLPVIRYAVLETAGNYALTWLYAGKFFRLRMVYLQGTSIVITSVKIEAKS